MRPLHFYLLGTGSWFLSFGIQSVMFAWLVTMVLEEAPKMVGIAQMALLLPTMLLMLVGGSLADHYGGRRVAMWGHVAASTAPLFLTIMVLLGQLTYSTIIVFAVMMGCAQAMVTPSRDGLLGLVAEGRIQRRVMQTSMIQFGVQMLGFITAGFAERVGASTVLLAQSCLLLIGALAWFKLDVPYQRPARLTHGIATQIRVSIVEGFLTVRESPFMRAVVIQNCAMGIFFMGSYIVSLPLVVRDVYGGSSTELSWMNAANSMGMVLTILLLLRFGDLHKQGRALLISQSAGAVALAGAGLGLGFPSLIAFIFCWGICGGVGMTMARTIMQELSPPNQRARMMAFFSFSFMGSGPLGALMNGYLCDWLGPTRALLVASSSMFAVLAAVALGTRLWQLDATPQAA